MSIFEKSLTIEAKKRQIRPKPKENFSDPKLWRQSLKRSVDN